MTAPTDRAQVEFLALLQRLLAEGDFTATYKFALLLALADIAVEKGDDSGLPMHVGLEAIAEKFIRLYWLQTAPHPAGDVLRQTTDQQAKIVGLLVEARSKHGGTLAALGRDAQAWGALVTKVARVVSEMPLFKLQTLGGSAVEFLYPNRIVNAGVELKPGIAFCLRRFHGLIEDLVRGAWVRFVRRLRANEKLTGEATDLSGFMFGTDRDPLGAFVPILRDLQMDTCFYCQHPIKGRRVAVDHFVPWSLYPVDLGHNFVLAHEDCNGAKREALAGIEHLERWSRRSADHGPALGSAFDEVGIAHDAIASHRVTTWAYANAEQSSAQLWVRAKEFVQIDRGWRAFAR